MRTIIPMFEADQQVNLCPHVGLKGRDLEDGDEFEYLVIVTLTCGKCHTEHTIQLAI